MPHLATGRAKWVREGAKFVGAAALFLALVFGVSELLRWVITIVFHGVSSNVVAAVVAAVASLGAIAFQRQRELKNQRLVALHERKSELYSPLLGKLFEFFDIIKDLPPEPVAPEAIAKFNEIRAMNPDLICWASDDVLASLARLRSTPPNPALSAEDNGLSFCLNVGNLFLAIRQDLGQSVAALRPGDILGMLFNEIPEMLGPSRALVIKDGVLQVITVPTSS